VSFSQHEGNERFAIEGHFTCGIGYEVVSLNEHGKNHLYLQLCKIVANTTHMKKGKTVIHECHEKGGGGREKKGLPLAGTTAEWDVGTIYRLRFPFRPSIGIEFESIGSPILLQAMQNIYGNENVHLHS